MSPASGMVVVLMNWVAPLFQARRLPPTPVPKKVEVATNDGAPVLPVPLAKMVLAPAVAAYEVVLPLEVMTPERLALVVTVAALPPMLSVLVDTWYVTPLFAPTRPFMVARTGALVNVCVRLQVFEVVVLKSILNALEEIWSGYAAEVMRLV